MDSNQLYRELFNENDYKERQKFYNSPFWKATRSYVLNNEPLCRKCNIDGILTPATVVDHIVDIVDDPDRKLDISNLQPLCRECHNEKTVNTVKQRLKNRKDKKWVLFRD